MIKIISLLLLLAVAKPLSVPAHVTSWHLTDDNTHIVIYYTVRENKSGLTHRFVTHHAVYDHMYVPAMGDQGNLVFSNNSVIFVKNK